MAKNLRKQRARLAARVRAYEETKKRGTRFDIRKPGSQNRHK